RISEGIALDERAAGIFTTQIADGRHSFTTSTQMPRKRRSLDDGSACDGEKPFSVATVSPTTPVADAGNSTICDTVGTRSSVRVQPRVASVTRLACEPQWMRSEIGFSCSVAAV